MLRLTNNSRVRRRLFDDEISDQAKVDNFANVLQESIKIDRIEKSKKWNFDFEKELPLQGTYEWYPCNDTADWIGVKSEKEPGLDMKEKNEVTPRTRDEKVLPLIRKRRREDLKLETTARRRISFD